MSYRVSFFKDLISSDGRQFRCLQRNIVIHRARNDDRAVEAAKRRFQRLCHVADWRFYADGFELRASEQVNCGRESGNEL
jgi:hypothetical protein